MAITNLRTTRLHITVTMEPTYNTSKFLCGFSLRNVCSKNCTSLWCDVILPEQRGTSLFNLKRGVLECIPFVDQVCLRGDYQGCRTLCPFEVYAQVEAKPSSPGEF